MRTRHRSRSTRKIGGRSCNWPTCNSGSPVNTSPAFLAPGNDICPVSGRRSPRRRRAQRPQMMSRRYRAPRRQLLSRHPQNSLPQNVSRTPSANHRRRARWQRPHRRLTYNEISVEYFNTVEHQPRLPHIGARLPDEHQEQEVSCESNCPSSKNQFRRFTRNNNGLRNAETFFKERSCAHNFLRVCREFAQCVHDLTLPNTYNSLYHDEDRRDEHAEIVSQG